MEERIRHSPLAPPPRPEFRARLRAGFIAGRLGDEGRAAEPAEPASTVRRGGFRLLLGGLALAAAAAVLVVLAGPGFETDTTGSDSASPVLGGGWRVAGSAQAGGLVRVDGNLLTLGDRARIEAGWNAGQALEAGDTPLELSHPDGLRLSLRPGTLARLGEDRDAAASPAWSLDLEHGEILLATDDGYTGRPVAFTTLDSSVLVTGTALSVMSGKQGTCICVQHGSVVVQCRKSGNLMHVGDEETCFVYSDRRPSFEGAFCRAVQEFGEDMREQHFGQLRAFSQ